MNDQLGEVVRFVRHHPFDCSLTTRFKAAHVLNFLRPHPKDAILDVGCGLGYFLNVLARRGLKGYGLDYSFKSLTLARRMTSGFLCQGDASMLPFRDNSFDKIIFTDVIEHVADDRGTLQEIVRVARDGALIALVTPGTRGVLASTQWRKLFHDEEGTPEFDQRTGYTKQGLRQMMEGVGIRIEEVRQTLIFLGEFFLQFTKWYLARKKVHYQTQGDILEITDSLAYRLYRRLLFPIFWSIGRLEEAILGSWVDGHSLIALGTVEKTAASANKDARTLATQVPVS